MRLSEKEIFNQAMDIEDEQRRLTFVREACSGDDALYESVTSLLAAYCEGTLLEQSPVAGVLERVISSEQFLTTQIGQYRLHGRIGGGGMGDLYLAEQSAPFIRKVAIKLLRPQGDRQKVIQRFNREKRALAMMDHANIARVLDAGIDASDTPFLVMELLDGTAITTFCSLHQLTVQQRIEVFLNVCRAIQHAHEKGVLHRDIKPSNVLVSQSQDQIVVKVIDFGLAKLLGEDSAATGLFDGSLTASVAFLGTPQFCSPEQASMGLSCIDQRSDIYSLGALLYNLLTKVPIRPNCHPNVVGFDEMRRIIRDTEPMLPSTAIRRQAATARREGAQPTHTSYDDAEITASQLNGDLDAILMRCLEQLPSDRYQRVSDLIRALQCWLQGIRVKQPKKSLSRRLTRMWQQQRRIRGVATGVLMLMVMAASAFLSSYRTEPSGPEHPAVEWVTLNQGLNSGNFDSVESEFRQSEKSFPGSSRGYDWYFLRSLLQSNGALPEAYFHAEGNPYPEKSLYHSALLKIQANEQQGIPEIHELLAVGKRGEINVVDPDPPHRVIKVIKGDQGELNSIVPSPDGRLFATCGDDGTIAVYDSFTKEQWHGARGKVDGTAFQSVWSFNGKMLAALSDIGDLRFFRIDEPSRSLVEHSQVKLEAKTECMVSNSDNEISICGRRGFRCFTRFPSESQPGMTAPIREFRAESLERIRGLAMSPDGRRVAFACEDGTVSVFDIKADPLLPLYEWKSDATPISVAFLPPLQDVPSAEDRSELAVGLTDGRVSVIGLKVEHQEPFELLVHAPEGDSAPAAFDGDGDGRPGGDWSTSTFSEPLRSPMSRSLAASGRIHCRRTFDLKELEAETITRLIQKPTGDFFVFGEGLKSGRLVRYVSCFTAEGGLSFDFGNKGVVLLDDVSSVLQNSTPEFCVEASSRGNLVFSWIEAPESEVDVLRPEDRVIRIVRLTPNGRLDTTFGVQGVLSINVESSYKSVDTIAVADNGEIAVVASLTPIDGLSVSKDSGSSNDGGSSIDGGSSESSTISIWKLDRSGHFDDGFGDSGRLSIAAPSILGRVVRARLTKQKEGQRLALAATLREGTTLSNGHSGFLLGIVDTDSRWVTLHGDPPGFKEFACGGGFVTDVLDLDTATSGGAAYNILARRIGSIEPRFYHSTARVNGTPTSGADLELSQFSNLTQGFPEASDGDLICAYNSGIMLVAHKHDKQGDQWILERSSERNTPAFVQLRGDCLLRDSAAGVECGQVVLPCLSEGNRIERFRFPEDRASTDNGLFSVTPGGKLLTTDQFSTKEHSVFAPAVEVELADGTVFSSEVIISTKDSQTVPLDLEFADDGVFKQNFTPHDDACNSVYVQSDGKIVSVGHAAELNVGNHDLFVCRQLPNGLPDPAFGDRGCVRISDLPRDSAVFDVVVDDRGRILVAGQIPEDPVKRSGIHHSCIFCISPDGSFDQTFGNNGKVLVPCQAEDFQDYSGFSTISLHPHGGFVAAGQVANSHQRDLWFAKMDVDGKLDESFGREGVVRIDLENRIDEVLDVTVLADGRILGCGLSESQENRWEASGLVICLHPNGKLDQNFGTGGFTHIRLNRPKTIATSIVIQPDQKILVGCMTGHERQFESGIARCLPNGQLDQSFGLNGGLNLPQPFKGERQSKLAFVADIGAFIVTQSAANLDTDTALTLLPLNSEGTGVLDSPQRYQSRISAIHGDGTYAAVQAADGGLILAGHLNDRPDTTYFVGKIARETLLGMVRNESFSPKSEQQPAFQQPNVARIVQVEPPLVEGFLPLGTSTVELTFDQSPADYLRQEHIVMRQRGPDGQPQELPIQSLKVCGPVVYAELPREEFAKVAGIGYRLVQTGDPLEITGVNVQSAESLSAFSSSPQHTTPSERRMAITGLHGLEVITQESATGTWRLPETLNAVKRPQFGLGAEIVSDQVADFQPLDWDSSKLVVRYHDNSFRLHDLQSNGIWLARDRVVRPPDGLTKFSFQNPSGIITGLEQSEDGKYRIVSFSAEPGPMTETSTNVAVSGKIESFAVSNESRLCVLNRSVPDAGDGKQSHEVLLIDLRTGRLLQKFPSSRCIDLKISSDDRFMVGVFSESVDVYQFDESRPSLDKIQSMVLTDAQSTEISVDDGTLRFIAIQQYAIAFTDDVLNQQLTHLPLKRTNKQHWGTIAPDHNTIVAVSNAGLSFWDLRTESMTLQLPVENCIKARFSSSGDHLFLLIRDREQKTRSPIGELYAVPLIKSNLLADSQPEM